MTTKSPERKVFKKYRKAMIDALGSQATDNDTLDKAGKLLFASWGGVHPSNRVKLTPWHYYIINVDHHDKPGSHWIGLYTTQKKAYLWDSYGRNPKRLVSALIANIHKHGMKVGKTNLVHHMEQIGYSSEVCGPNSLAWLLTVKDVGITRAKNI